MATDLNYDLDKMLSGVLFACFDARGCRHCYRKTQHPLIGHDGFCPTPALFKLADFYKEQKEIKNDHKS